MNDEAWVAVLDELDERIASTEAALDADDILLDAFQEPFTPPANLGPLPENLRKRAQETLRRQAETEQRIAETIASVKRDLSKATRQRGVAEKANVYRDTPISQFFDSNV